MARGYTNRKLEVWTLAAHVAKGRVDYRAMFRDMAALPATQRQWEDDERVVAIPSIEIRRGGKVYLTAVEGPRGQPLIFDTEQSKERTGRLRPGEIVATRTHALIDLRTREAIVEYNHRGAKARDIATTLGESGRRIASWRTLYVVLNPKVATSFANAIDAFERIRIAGVRVARPNVDWTDWDDDLTEYASESDAQSAEVEFVAKRGESLSRLRGIIPFIKSRSEDGAASMKNAYVVGRRPDDAAETKVTLNDHKEHERVSVRIDDEQRVDEADIRRQLDRYDRERRKADGN